MNGTWKDDFTARVRRQKEAHRFLKAPIAVFGALAIAVLNIALFFARNTKRFGCAMLAVIFFFASSSFSFPPQEEDVSFVMGDEWTNLQESYEYAPTKFNIPAEEVIDDDDVIEGYDNAELDVSMDEIDQYSLDDILEANEVTTGSGGAQQTSVFGLSRDDWQLVLVNKQHPVPEDYTFTLGTIKGRMKCDARIIDDLMDMMQAAKADGITLMVCSPYRDYNRQTVLFNRKIDYYMEKGYSYLEAYKISSMTVTVPGASEHQIGLALDIVSTTYSALETGFGETKAGLWLREHCDEYGFILRYPLGKEYITGIQYEPWHFRYVGKEAAAEIMERDITLEEFLEELE